MPGTVPRVDWE